MTVIEWIVQQHVEEASFVWTQRDAAVCGPLHELYELANLDNRVESHLEGLRISGEPGWLLCQKELEEIGEVGEVFTAGVLAIESGRKERIDKVLEIAASAPELERGMISALGWVSSDNASKGLAGLSASVEPAVRRIGLAAVAVRRRNPGALLLQLIQDDEPRIRTRALKAAGELGRTDLIPDVIQALHDPDDDARFYAAWSAARLGQRNDAVRQVLIELAQQPGPRQISALAMALRILDVPAAKAWLHRMAQDPKRLRAATIGIGFLGDPKLVGVLIELMQSAELARVAGDSFSMITGIDLTYDNMEQDAPEGFESGPTEEAEDENVALDEDENLPWPNPGLIAQWWTTNTSRFSSGRRYLCGREITTESTYQTLLDGKQRQRAAAAIEFALLRPENPLFEVRANGSQQQRLLGHRK